MRTWRVTYRDLDDGHSYSVEVEATTAREAVYRVRRDNQWRVDCYRVQVIA